jgi:hypothetical protein
MKKITVTILVALLLIGTITAYADSPFSDLKSSNWAYQSVNAMKEKGIIEGFPDGSFKPAKSVTYGEFIKMLVSSMGYTNLPAPVVTPDTPPTQSHWAYSYYQKSVELKLFMKTELSSDKYQLDSEIPRQMMAYMISNALGDIDLESKYAEYKAKINDIPDGNEYMYPVVKVYCTGILNGYPDGSFKPKGSLTRAETAASLERYIKYSGGEEIAAVKQQEAEDKAEKESAAVENYLQKPVDFVKGMSNYYQYYGVESAEELKEVYPLVYYAILQPWQSDPLFNTKVTNIEEMHSPFANNYSSMTYAYKNMEDIGITKIEKTVGNYNCEHFIVTPKYASTERMNAFLVKGDQIVCYLNGSKLYPGYILDYGTPNAHEYTGDTIIDYGVPYEYYNGAKENTKLPDFDYIGFVEYDITPEVFLVKKPW